jgi:hypothetical protein
MRRTDDLDEAMRLGRRGRAARASPQRRPPRQRAEVLPELVRRGVIPDIVTDQTSAHDELTATSPTASRSPTPPSCAARPARLRHPQHRSTHGQARRRDAGHAGRAARRLRLRQQHPRPGREGRLADAFRSPASSRSTSARCSARVRARSAGPRSRATRRTSTPPTRRSSSCSPRRPPCAAGSSSRASRSSSRASPAGSAGSATANATAPACSSTSWSAAARSRRRSSSAATTSTAAASPRPTARPRP